MTKPKSAKDTKKQHSKYAILEITLDIYAPKHKEEMCDDLFDLLQNTVNKFLKKYNKKYQLDGVSTTHLDGYEV